jgi:pilus assembly protein Flp/PilA
MLSIYHYFKTFLKDQRGVSAIEYAVLAAIIVGLLVSAFGGDEGLSSIIEQTFETIKTKITELTAAE